MLVKYAFILSLTLAISVQSEAAAKEKTLTAEPEAIVAYPASQHSRYGLNAAAPRSANRARKHRLDLDRDGYVSKSELEQDQHRRQSAFSEADQNSDGRLNPEEARRFQVLVKEKSRKRKR
jgi:EF hand